MKKNRIWTPELERRRNLFSTLQGLGISLEDLAAESGLNSTTFSKVLWGEYPGDQTSEVLKIVEKAVARGLKANKRMAKRLRAAGLPQPHLADVS
jgi:hypothetical protein